MANDLVIIPREEYDALLRNTFEREMMFKEMRRQINKEKTGAYMDVLPMLEMFDTDVWDYIK